MYKTWMSENLVNKLDLEGIIALNPEAIEAGLSVKDEVSSLIAMIDNSLCCSKFVIKHLEDIKHNIKVLDDCCYSLLGIMPDWENEQLNGELKDEVKSYFEFFNGITAEKVPITLRCGDVSVPKEPFSHVLSYVENMQMNSFDKSNANESLKKKALNGRSVANDVANQMDSLIKYDIRTEYPSFDENKYGIFEKLFSSKPDWESSDVEDIENSLLDAKDQLECVDQILNGAV